jgi:signal transduction histidine kinase/DNA-binding response OmpR family regulator
MSSPSQLLSAEYLFSRLKQNPINKVAAVAFMLLIATYLSGIFSQAQLAEFTRAYADFGFLALILACIMRHIRRPQSIVDPIYWLLLGTAYATWFMLTILRLTAWPHLTVPAQGLITNLVYFLHFALVIAAIEVKSYQKAKQLLSKQSVLIWSSTFVFVLGCFMSLVLATSNQTDPKAIDSIFAFYIIMDCYLVVRWLHLAWTSRANYWLGYVLFALGALMFAVADISEALYHAKVVTTKAGGWGDWLWFIPYVFIYLGLQFPVTTSVEQAENTRFLRAHTFNSPMFYVFICFLLVQIYSQSPDLLTQLNQNQFSILNLTSAMCIVLALLQFAMLGEKHRAKRRHLKSITSANKMLEQHLIQQAEKLERQSASNKTILETTHNAIFTLNNLGVVLSCNPAASSLLRMPENEIIGSVFIHLLNAEGELVRFFSYQSYRQKLATQKDGIEIQSQITDAKGTPIAVHVTLSQDQNSSDGILVVSLVNISEQKKAEDEAHQLKDQFTANISHEFRTPLTIINGVLDNLINQPRYNGDSEQLQTAKRNTLRMVRMVDQLLELSKIANNSVPISAIDGIPTSQFVCASFEEYAQNSQIEFNYALCQQAWIKGNNEALEKILFNLISNAFKYTQQGQVNVELSEMEHHYKLVVKDTGIGISQEQQYLIFERFHRVNNEVTQSVHGVGIGLALVKELCDTMLWDLKISSKINHGSRFIITIPKADKQDVLALVAKAKLAQNKVTQGKSSAAGMIRDEISAGRLVNSSTAEASSIDEPSGQLDEAVKQPSDNLLAKNIESEIIDIGSQHHHKHVVKSEYSVLIVEDNSDMQTHIKEILSPYHQCLLADNGEEGVRLAIDYVPDIIVSDVMMPGISGFDLLRTLKKTEITTHIPIILLTARSDSASKIRGLEAQADDYLSKPFDAEELRLRVNNQLVSREKLQQKLNNRANQEVDDVPVEEAIEDKFVNKLEAIFAEEYTESSFSMVELASALAMSDRQVQRKIKAVLGISPMEALKQFRLKQAKKRLQAGEQIGVVALSCGFSSQSYFGRCFKENYKMTPKAFQQSLNKDS